MKTNTLLVVIISLFIGGGIGYALNNRSKATAFPIVMDRDMMMHGNAIIAANDYDMGTMMMDMTSRMYGKTGNELDRIFLEDMIVHHQGAVDMAMIIKENTNRPELKAFAQDIIDVQDQEITMMESWLAGWFTQKN